MEGMNSNGDYDLKSVSEKTGQAPKSRLTSARAVRNLYSNYTRANQKRARRNALVKGMIDGNPPYDQTALDAAAQRYRSNFNSGEGESYLGTATGAFYDLFSEVDTYATVTVDMDHEQSVVWGDILTREFDWLQKQDDSMEFGIQLSQHNMVLYGYGAHVWEDALDWRSKAIAHSDMLLPDDALANVNDWERVMFRAIYRVDELHRYIADPEAAAQRGWNLTAVRRSLMRADGMVYSGVGNEIGNWENWQQKLRNNDLEFGERCARIRCARILYREFSKSGEPGKISEAWVDLNDTEDDFLYARENAYDEMTQAVCAFFYDRGDGYAHSVRGLGGKMFRMLMAKMRLTNTVVDAAFARAAVMLKALGGGAGESQLAITHLGPYSILPTGYDFVPTGVPGVLDAPMMVDRELGNTLASNLSQYRQRLDRGPGNPRTATEITQNAQQAALLNKTQIARYYEQLDEWYTERFRRATNRSIPKTSAHKWAELALAFQNRVLVQGVPSVAFRRARVRATRTIGEGSHFLRIQMLNSLFQTVYAALPEDGKERLVTDMIAAQAGRQQVTRYYPVPQRRNGEAQHRWDAQIENDTLRNRGQISLTPYQNDVIHTQEHLAFGSQAAASLQQGADPMDIFGVLQAVGAHTAMHLQRLGQNPLRTEETKVLAEQFTQLAKISDELGKQIQERQQAMAEAQAENQAKMQQAQAITQGTDPDTQIKVAEAAQDMRLKEAKTHQGMALKAAKTRQDMALKDAKTAQEMAGAVLTE